MNKTEIKAKIKENAPWIVAGVSTSVAIVCAISLKQKAGWTRLDITPSQLQDMTSDVNTIMCFPTAKTYLINTDNAKY